MSTLPLKTAYSLTRQVVILRHGESQCNQLKIWSGWSDVQLTPKGQQQALDCAKLLKLQALSFDRAYCSRLTRSIKTLNIILDQMNCLYLPVSKCWQLNQKFYGALQGVNKLKMVETYGKEKVQLWRRSFTVSPPEMLRDNPQHPIHDRKYKDVSPDLLPNSENMADVLRRVRSVYQQEIKSKLVQKQNLLIVGHGSTVRAFSHILMGFSEEEASKFQVPNATPLLIHLNEDLLLKQWRILGDTVQVQNKMTAARNELTKQ